VDFTRSLRIIWAAFSEKAKIRRLFTFFFWVSKEKSNKKENHLNLFSDVGSRLHKLLSHP
jgi:hypothetical protein